MKHVGMRLLFIGAVLVLSVLAILPPDQKIPLGLDLKGGVRLVLRVHTDEALQLETQAAVERIRDGLTRRGAPFTRIEATGPVELVVEGASDEAALREVAAELDAVFARVASGQVHVFRMKSDVERRLRQATVEQALATVERRVNELGVTEPTVMRHRRQDQIDVQLPGVTEVERARQIIRSTAQLRLTLVEQGPFASHDEALRAYRGDLPSGFEVLPFTAGDATETVHYVVRAAPAVSGRDLRGAQQSFDEFNRPAVAFTLTQDAARRFGQFTEAHVGRSLATVLDNRVTSVATIMSRIDDRGRITGLSREEMLEQVVTLNAGALPASMDYVEDRTVGPSLGADSVRAGVLASAGGFAVVMLFMLACYRMAGVIAVLSIVLNLIVLLALLVAVGAAMTLPGIAGLILTIGIGVDSNVLIFERIREELAAARGVRAAVDAGFHRVWRTIVDTHVASLIAAAFLFQFGAGPIRGFATTLALGLLANVFTAVFVSRTIFALFLSGRRTTVAGLSLTSPLGRRPLAVLRWFRYTCLASVFVIGAGLAVTLHRGVPVGIDFSGGTQLVIAFDRDALLESDVRRALDPLRGDRVVQRYGPAEDRRMLVRIAPDPSEREESLDAGVGRVSEALRGAGLGSFEIVDRELVTAAVGEELQRRALWTMMAATMAVATFIGVRYRPSFAWGATVAVLHDVLVTLACVSLAGYELTLHVVAALLLTVGYSVNDTIVIFDRVRENMASVRPGALGPLMERSIGQTLRRTAITSGTTCLAVLALYVFGGEVLRGFAFTMLAGVASGTYSSIFIAPGMTLLGARWRGGRGMTAAAVEPR